MKFFASVLVSTLCIPACAGRAKSHDSGEQITPPNATSPVVEKTTPPDATLSAAENATPTYTTEPVVYHCDLVVRNNSDAIVEEVHKDSNGDHNFDLRTKRFWANFDGTRYTLQFTPAMAYTMGAGSHANLNAPDNENQRYDILRAYLDCKKLDATAP